MWNWSTLTGACVLWVCVCERECMYVHLVHPSQSLVLNPLFNLCRMWGINHENHENLRFRGRQPKFVVTKPHIHVHVVYKNLTRGTKLIFFLPFTQYTCTYVHVCIYNYAVCMCTLWLCNDVPLSETEPLWCIHEERVNYLDTTSSWKYNYVALILCCKHVVNPSFDVHYKTTTKGEAGCCFYPKSYVLTLKENLFLFCFFFPFFFSMPIRNGFYIVCFMFSRWKRTPSILNPGYIHGRCKIGCRAYLRTSSLSPYQHTHPPSTPSQIFSPRPHRSPPGRGPWKAEAEGILSYSSPRKVRMCSSNCIMLRLTSKRLHCLNTDDF